MNLIIKEILLLISISGKNVASRLSEQAGISRQAASSRISNAIKKGFVISSGKGRGICYRIAELNRVHREFTRVGLSEDNVWREVLAPIVAEFPINVRDIWHYGFTEMVNNAIDHSDAKSVYVWVVKNPLFTQAWIADNGIGIFLKIQQSLNLFDPRESILELAKGKLTTDPSNHSGEGIFFSSKVFDLFDIRSGSLHFMHDDGLNDLLIERDENAEGTLVVMRLFNDSMRTTKEIFDKFTTDEEYTFAKTIVPVRLAQYEGEKLVSRSQAKRLIFRFEKFKTVFLDFSGVEEIGQAFSDEVFRVFQTSHADTKLVPVNMSDSIRNMVSRAKSNL
jgi:hypothetical protein